ncbi:MAG: GxxExxY protein [Gammaproteobacteria bacterium]
MTENEAGTIIVDAAVAIHRRTGPGLLESVYEAILVAELRKRGLHVERQASVPISYDGQLFKEGFRADLLVERKVIVELKSVDRVMPAHRKQVQTYLRLSGCKLGYLLNFGAPLMKSGIYRCANGI